MLRLFVLLTLASAAVFAEAPPLHIRAIRTLPADVNPDADAATIFQLAIGAGTLAPTDAGGNPLWPCFTGDVVDWPDCSGIASGALVIGSPIRTVSLASCTAGSTIPCLWLFSIVQDEDTDTTADLVFSMKVTQGSAILFDTGAMDFGPNAPSIYILSGNVAFGPGNCPRTETCVAPVAGTAKLIATLSVGSSKASGSTNLNFQNGTATRLVSGLNPSIFGESVTFTATVTPNDPEPTGTVTFSNGSTEMGTATLAGGVATLDYSMLSAASHSVTATYGGDALYAGSTSLPLTQTVNQAATSTTVTSSKNPSNQGESVTFTATVTSQDTTPQGTVTFTKGSTKLGTSTLASGQANLAVTGLPAGKDTVTATYNPTANFTGSSGNVVQTVN